MIKNYSTKSWHYRLARVYGNLKPYYNNHTSDICTYIRACMVGVAFMFAIITLSSLALLFALAPILPIIASIQYGGIIEFSEIQVTSLACWVISAGCLVFYSTVELIKRIPKSIIKVSLPTIPTDNFVFHAYQSIKDKMCFKLVFTEELSEFNVIPHKIGVKLSKRDRDDTFTFILPVGKELDRDLTYHAVMIYDLTTNKVLYCCVKPDEEEALGIIEELRTAPHKTASEVNEIANDYFYW